MRLGKAEWNSVLPENDISTVTGYENGLDQAPDYRDVCSGSGHAGSVK